jgi:tetratricopeptide (TPR) repeat protein
MILDCSEMIRLFEGPHPPTLDDRDHTAHPTPPNTLLGLNGATFEVLPILLDREARDLEQTLGRAERDLRDLLELPHEERLAKVRRAIRRFRGVTLARMLLAEARLHFAADSRAVYELSETAQAVLHRTPMSAGMADLLARAAAFMGNALRAAGDLSDAEGRFTFARHVITHSGVTDLLVYAEVDWLEGILRKDQRQFVQAEELLVRAVLLYRLAGEEGAVTYPLMSLGLLYYDRQEYEQAQDIFRTMLQIVQPEAEPRLYCYAHHNLTLTLCELGDYAAAEDHLAAGRRLYREHPDLYTQSRLTWLKGKIAAGLGRLGEAEAAFAAIRQEFAAEGNAYDAAMASLDLALVYLRQGRTAELGELAEEAHRVFEAQDVHREEHAALLLFRDAVRQERVTADLIRELMAYLKKARLYPKLRFKGVSRAAGIGQAPRECRPS